MDLKAQLLCSKLRSDHYNQTLVPPGATWLHPYTWEGEESEACCPCYIYSPCFIALAWRISITRRELKSPFFFLLFNPGIPVEDRVNIFINSFGSIQETTMVRIHFLPMVIGNQYSLQSRAVDQDKKKSALSFKFEGECSSVFSRRETI